MTTLVILAYREILTAPRATVSLSTVDRINGGRFKPRSWTLHQNQSIHRYTPCQQPSSDRFLAPSYINQTAQLQSSIYALNRADQAQRSKKYPDVLQQMAQRVNRVGPRFRRTVINYHSFSVLFLLERHARTRPPGKERSSNRDVSFDDDSDSFK